MQMLWALESKFTQRIAEGFQSIALDLLVSQNTGRCPAPSRVSQSAKSCMLSASQRVAREDLLNQSPFEFACKKF